MQTPLPDPAPARVPAHVPTHARGRRPRGRPRGFEAAEALDAAMRLFWAEGFEAPSIDRLCREARMSRASLYQTYGGKEALFLATVAHYGETRIGPVVRALGPRGTLAEDFSAFFAAVIALATRDARTPGCLISCVLADAAGANPTLRRELDLRFTALEERIAFRLGGAGGADQTRALAGMLAAVARGIMLRARSGAAPADLEAIAAVAVRGLPCA